MEPFFYLHAELDLDSERDRCFVDAVRDPSSTSVIKRPPVTTCLSVFGKDASGHTVVVRIRGYRIHFYVSFRNAQLSRHCCTRLMGDSGDARVVAMKTVNGYRGMLLDKEHQPGAPYDYADTSLSNVVLVQVRTKRDVSEVVRLIDDMVNEYCADGKSDAHSSSAVSFYESNMDVITAATRRLGLNACSWCFLDTGWCVLENGETPSPVAGREFVFYETGTTDAATLFSRYTGVSMPPRVKIMSFDIECLSSDAESMPDASEDPVIQISSVVSLDALGRSTVAAVECSTEVHLFHRHLFTTGGRCDPIDGVLIHECEDEASLLREFANHVHHEDPEIMTGYNICNFDLPYLFGRMRACGIDARMGRCGRVAVCEKRNDGAATRRYAPGLTKTHDTRFYGRVLFDMYAHMRKEVVLRSYTLNSVSSHFLGEKKDDVSYREIPSLYNGDGTSRARLGRYCVKDAQLVLELAFKTQTFVHAFERCKVFRTPLHYTVERGQQARFYAMLLAWCSERKILVNDVTSRRAYSKRTRAETTDRNDVRWKIPRPDEFAVKYVRDRDCVDESDGEEKRGTREEEQDRADEYEDNDGERSSRIDNVIRRTARARGEAAGKPSRSGYEGATVLEPIPGLYRTPVICLDYASLYPSIMIAYNLCFTTFVRDRQRGEELTESGAAERSPIGYYFLKRSVKKGVIPSILEMLLEERAEVRRSMNGLQDTSIEYKLLDGQQWAIKIAANSIYGAIGCVWSILYFVEIPSSVTAYGRDLITRTRDHVEVAYPGSRVVYGDTDSVMVNLYDWDVGLRPIWECAEAGKHMANTITDSIARPPIRLQFETVYRPFLLFTKKRYAAGVYNGLERLAAMEPDAALASCRSTIKYKGLQVVRRDNCTFSTRLMRFVLESLMDERCVPIEHVLEGLRAELKLLFDGHVNMKELVITKEWKRRYSASAQAHDIVARRMELRDPNSAPSIGDRVPYVITDAPRGAKLCDRAEDPLYVMENDLSPDLLYYADNQVAKPIAELLRVALRHQGTLEEIKDLFWPEDAPRREGDRRRGPGEVAWTRRASVGSRRVTEFFTVTGSMPTGVGDDDRVEGSARELAEIEDLLDGLADKCMACKANNADAVRSCRDHECETLYERFSKLNLRHRAVKKRYTITSRLGRLDAFGDPKPVLRRYAVFLS